MREIKFREPHYHYDGTFYLFIYWGFIDDNFQGPRYCNATIKKPCKKI